MSHPDPTFSNPRILCLHGGGVNASVFRAQCRALISSLTPQFRFVFVDAPFACAPHAAIAPVYGDYGPFFRWLRFEDHHAAVDAREAAAQILAQCRAVMDDDPGTGEWVGLLGFSQGAKVAASLLWLQERLAPRPLPLLSVDVRFKFAVLLAGGPPLVILDPTRAAEDVPRHVDTAEGVGFNFEDWPETNEGEHVLGLPTLHVHRLQEPGLERHRMLLKLYCKRGTTRLVEWNGGHRLPIKSSDVDLVTKELLETAREAGAL